MLNKDKLYDIITYIFVLIVNIVITVLLCIFFTKGCKGNITAPVEKNDNDSLKLATDNIKNTVDSIENVKLVKINETLNLSNDSSIELFYRLVSE